MRQVCAAIGWVGIALASLMFATSAAEARCDRDQIEAFLQDRAFELSADEKISLYGRRLARYYDKRDLSRRRALREMRAWEARWPERIYKFIRVTDFREAPFDDACRVSFDYRFLAYSPSRDRVSAGIGNTTLVLADFDGDRAYQIVSEFGRVSCRGLQR
ncbi:MAG: hypothetical protein AAFQ35_09970, partial [Pseudomonadota bacterium]